MFKKFKLVTALAIIVALMSSLTVLADGLDENGAVIAADENFPAQAAITKVLLMPDGTIPPDATFQFMATKISLDGDESQEATDAMPDLNFGNMSVMIDGNSQVDILGDVIGGGIGIWDPGKIHTMQVPSIGDDPNPSPIPGFGHPTRVLGSPDYYDSIGTVTVETSNILDGVNFPYAGIYVYEITEIPGTYTVADLNHEVMTFSDARYTLTVYAANTSDSSDTYVYAITDTFDIDDSGSEAGGAKVDPTPGGDGVDYGTSQMIFTNTYVKTNGAWDPDDPNLADENDYTLSVSKTVAGNMANEEEYFVFSMDLFAPALLVNAPDFYKAYVVEDGVAVTSYDNGDIGGSDAGGDYISVSTGETTTFALKNGQELVFVDTPVGTSYDVTEAGATGYSPSYVITTDNIQSPSVDGFLNGELGTDSQLVGESVNRADFTNTRDLITPTGLSMNDLPFIVMIIMAAAVLAGFIVVKSRKQKRNER